MKDSVRKGKEYPVSQASEAPPGRQVHLLSSESIELRVNCRGSEVPSFETYGCLVDFMNDYLGPLGAASPQG